MKPLLCALAVLIVALSARSEEAPEAGKARIDMQFKEGGGKGAPKDSDAVYAGEGRKHSLKFSQIEAERSQAPNVPVAGVVNGQSSTASDKADECAKSNAPRATVFGGAVGTVIGAVIGFFAGGVGAVPGAAGGGVAGAIVAGTTTVMICREANGIPAFGS